MTNLTVNFGNATIQVPDWGFMINAVENLDTPEVGSNRRQIRGKTALMILAEYGAIAYDRSYPPNEVRLAVVVFPTEVYFCPSVSGLDGVFIEPYDLKRHGPGIKFEKSNLFDFSNIKAKLDAWDFYAIMLSR